jgi:hypothetical protein
MFLLLQRSAESDAEHWAESNVEKTSVNAHSHRQDESKMKAANVDRMTDMDQSTDIAVIADVIVEMDKGEIGQDNPSQYDDAMNPCQ